MNNTSKFICSRCSSIWR